MIIKIEQFMPIPVLNMKSVRNGGKYRRWSQESLNEALRQIRSGELKVTEASKKFKVPRTTIFDRLRNRVDEQCPMGRKRALTPQQEIDLCKYMNHMNSCGSPLTKNEVLHYVRSLDKKNGRNVFGDNGPSEMWWSLFMARHKSEIKLRKANHSDRVKDLSSSFGRFQDYVKLPADNNDYRVPPVECVDNSTKDEGMYILISVMKEC